MVEVASGRLYRPPQWRWQARFLTPGTARWRVKLTRSRRRRLLRCCSSSLLLTQRSDSSYANKRYRRNNVRKVISGLFISVDGVTESPEKWQFDNFDEDMMAGL